MLLTIFALMLGTVIGLLRGGRWSGVNAARLRGKGFLISGITATLVLNILGPSHPMFWLIISFVSFIGFAISNMALSGMIVLLIGIGLNLLPVLANGAVPVSELALESVGVLDDGGAALIEGARESTATATRLSFLGDVIPVPLANKVVSLGDLIVLVAVADIIMNLLLRKRERSLDDGGVTYIDTREADTEETASKSEVAAELEPVGDEVEPEPATRKHLRYFVSALPSGKPPAHAVLPEPEPAPVTSYTDPADLPPPTGQPVTTIAALSPVGNGSELPFRSRAVSSTKEIFRRRHEKMQMAVSASERVRNRPEHSLDKSAELPEDPSETSEPAPADSETSSNEADIVLDLTDRRPVIDLTVSPSDDQLTEFLRRRFDADLRLAEQAELASRQPRHRRGRARSRRRDHGKFADSPG